MNKPPFHGATHTATITGVAPWTTDQTVYLRATSRHLVTINSSKFNRETGWALGDTYGTGGKVLLDTLKPIA